MKSLCQLSYHIAIKCCNSYILRVNDFAHFFAGRNLFWFSISLRLFVVVVYCPRSRKLRMKDG